VATTSDLAKRTVAELMTSSLVNIIIEYKISGFPNLLTFPSGETFKYLLRICVLGILTFVKIAYPLSLL
jgi:hypothetical protein